MFRDGLIRSADALLRKADDVFPDRDDFFFYRADLFPKGDILFPKADEFPGVFWTIRSVSRSYFSVLFYHLPGFKVLLQ